MRYCRNETEKNILQKNRKKLLRWLENGCNADAVCLIFLSFFVGQDSLSLGCFVHGHLRCGP